MEDIKKWLWEGLKTAGRFFLAAVIPVLLDTALSGIQVLMGGVATLHIGNTEKWFITMMLVAADKAVHEWKKETRVEGSWKGLLGF
jgi:uncharacterized membrane protein